jgi:hypothetical protein
MKDEIACVMVGPEGLKVRVPSQGPDLMRLGVLDSVWREVDDAMKCRDARKKQHPDMHVWVEMRRMAKEEEEK